MNGDKRNFSLSIWDHNDNFLCLLKPASGVLEGQSYNEILTSNINGEETLSFTIPAYIDSNKENDKWNYIFNEQKIRYIEYENDSNKPKENGIKEFVLKHYEENRNGYEKIIQCQCESLAVYELSKIGWGITFDTEYISLKEQLNNPEDYITLDYWLKKIFYKETNLGRVSTTTECTYLLQGLQLRNDEGYPIENQYSINENGDYYFKITDEYVCDSIDSEEFQKYYNPTGWTWEIQAIDPRRVDKEINTSILYEQPVIDRYIEVTPNNFLPYSYQCGINEDDSAKTLKPHPIENKELRYVTPIKKLLISCERSNVFSIIQNLCESFGVWAYFIYEYNEQGKIQTRKIIFKTTVINEKIIFDFSYGKNLQSCSRVIDSNELVTKLIIPDTESNLDSNRILSIKQAAANQTGEGYIYNFEYFYNNGNLSKLTNDEKNGVLTSTHSDEYNINYHCGILKKINSQISNVQSYLVPLYDRQISLSTDLTVQEASIIAIKDNMKDIQHNKIDPIPEDQQIVKSWVSQSNQQNHIGELKTITTTTYNSEDCYYINFGREDVLYKEIENISICSFDEDGELEILENNNAPVEQYIPRYYKNSSRSTQELEIFIEDDDEINFDLMEQKETADDYKIDYTVLDDGTLPGFIKGIYIFPDKYSAINRNWIRIRYKYAPLAFYYKLLTVYWEKIKTIEETTKQISENLQEINNKIISNEIILKNLLNKKNELILQFEKKYGNYIKEGYWEPTDYQSQQISEQINTNNPKSYYEGFTKITKRLGDLNLNESLHNYTYYIKLPITANSIYIDKIEMKTYSPVPGYQNSLLSRYRGSDYEIFIEDKTNYIILGIAPSLIDTYQKNKYKDEFYKSKITIYFKDNNSQTSDYDWTLIKDNNNPIIQERYLYLSNDNILTNFLQIYGKSDESQDNLLEYGTDYTYNFDCVGYVNGNRVPLDEQKSYNDNIQYDYIIKIILKNSDKVNEFGEGPYIIKYVYETTLQYLYNDALNMSDKYSVPQITYSISIVDLSSLNEYENYKPILGQKVPIYDIEMRLNGYEGIITSISKDLERPENTQIELSTYQTKFEDIFEKLTVTMTDVRYNQANIINAANAFSIENGTIKSDIFQKSLEDNNFLISMGVNNDITIDKQSGITLHDIDNDRAVKIIGNGIFLTNNYSSTPQWMTGITGDGINASAITAGNIDTKQISIWNSSEGQIRFMWNDQGLFAYGDKTVENSSASIQDFIDYNKYVKFSYNGLEFQDSNGEVVRSRLTLGWTGLNITAQNEALELNAEKGLLLQQWKNNNPIVRLELGKLDNDSVYGLKLYDKNGIPTFQSDSDGDLWLHKEIKIGGSINSNGIVENANAGIYGLQEQVPSSYQMGIMRKSDGTLEWKNSAIRYWAGPQTKKDYLEQLYIDSNEINISIWNEVNDYDPTLARFKVDEFGNIIASGIDVGGWIGSGKILRSSGHQAILRSGEYNINNLDYPVLAIGRPNQEDTDYSKSGLNHNFRVYQDGSLNIGDNNFTISHEGEVVANNLIITGGSISIGILKDIYGNSILDENNNEIPNFYVDNDGNVTAKSIQIQGGGISGTGININNKFIVHGDTGQVEASDIVITGANNTSNWIIDSNEFQVSKTGQIGAGIIPLEQPSSFNANNYDFSVSGGDIRFKGNIYAYYGENWYRGIDSAYIDIYQNSSGTVYQTVRVVQGLIVGR